MEIALQLSYSKLINFRIFEIEKMIKRLAGERLF